MIRFRYIAVISLVFTTVFFLEYTPLWRQVHIPFDLEEFHYPLLDYAFQALHEGRFPQWDPSIYSGLTFVGNIQAGLFYPPTWLMFGISWARAKLPYQAVENLALAHVWLAFVLTYWWLYCQKRLHPVASALGGGVFAFSGYMMLQLQHLGLIEGYAWFPLGFAGIDALAKDGRRRLNLKLVVSSTMCFLAGYPTAWLVFSVCMLAYAGARKGSLKTVSLTLCALGASLCVAAIQLVPAWEAAQLKVPEAKYGPFSGIKDPGFFISYLVPNYFDFGLDVPTSTNPGKEYLYLGAAAIVGVISLISSKANSGMAPPLAVCLVSFLFLVNPFGLAGFAITASGFLSGLTNAWYFLAGLTAGVTLLAAYGLDRALGRASGPVPARVGMAIVLVSIAWSLRLVSVWIHGGTAFAAGWLSAFEPLVSSALLGILIVAFPGSSGRTRAFVVLAALVLAAADYKAFGTSKRFNASRGPYREEYVSQPFPNLNTAVYDAVRQHPEYRIALDRTAPFPQKLRHGGLATPQGFDPFLPELYQILVERFVRFRTNREFDLTPHDGSALQVMGVRYFMTSKEGPLASELATNRHFRLLLPDDSYYKVFEYLDARPAFGWEGSSVDQTVELKIWRPEQRTFVLNSPSGGLFRLSEQFYPGWSASVDNLKAAIERCHDAYDCITVPAGVHTIEFRYRSLSLFVGALISFCSLVLIVSFAVT